MSEGSKFDRSVDHARNKAAGGAMTPAPGAQAPATTEHPPGVAVMVKQFGSAEGLQAEVNEDLASGKFEAAPRIFKFLPYSRIEGFLEGHGPMAEFTDTDTGEVTYVKTWIIANHDKSVRISILSSAQLDRQLNGFIGSWVKIARGGEVNIAGTRKRMTEYAVWGPRNPGGVPRQWFDLSNEDRARIAASNGQHALPAGRAIDTEGSAS